MAAAVLILTACGEYEVSSPPATSTIPPAPPTFSPATPTPWTSRPTRTPDVERGLTVFLSAACTACHTIDSVPEAVGEIGPNLSTVASTAGSRVDGLTAEEYLWQSITDPSAFLVDGYGNLQPTGLVPDETDLDNLIAYLLTLE